MRIALVGTRGIPARYGGFETFAEELSKRLVERGHTVVVFGRTRRFPYSTEQSLDGVSRVNTWTVFGKHLETPLASLSAFVYLLFRRVDVVILCNAANSIFASLARLVGIPVVINVDGVERKRAKWGALGRWWYRIGEVSSLLFGNKVIADAYSIGDYYASEYGCGTERVVYGASADSPGSTDVLEKFGLEEGKYLLYVSRLEPENNALGVVQAYCKSSHPFPLVIVGDAPYAAEYIQRVKSEANDRVIFTGYQFGDAYRALQKNCFLYIQATEVGGTHPALIESMAFGNAIIANGVPEHFEVLGGAGVYYPRNDFERLAELITHLVANPETVEAMQQLAAERAKRLFSWESIADEYETLCANILKIRGI